MGTPAHATAPLPLRAHPPCKPCAPKAIVKSLQREGVRVKVIKKKKVPFQKKLSTKDSKGNLLPAHKRSVTGYVKSTSTWTPEMGRAQAAAAAAATDGYGGSGGYTAYSSGGYNHNSGTQYQSMSFQ